MRIFVGADHAGFGHKEKLISYLQELGHEVIDKGAYEYNEDDDFPDYIIPVAREVALRPYEVRGIVFGGSGQGEAMAANKFRGVRATVYYGPRESVVEDASGVSIINVSRGDNDSNLLSLGCRFITVEEMKEAVKEWLEAPFKNTERYIRRIQKMDRIHDTF
jgi:ribose 5-phosphate isomerase B